MLFWAHRVQLSLIGPIGCRYLTTELRKNYTSCVTLNWLGTQLRAFEAYLVSPGQGSVSPGRGWGRGGGRYRVIQAIYQCLLSMSCYFTILTAILTTIITNTFLHVFCTKIGPRIANLRIPCVLKYRVKNRSPEKPGILRSYCIGKWKFQIFASLNSILLAYMAPLR